MVPGFHLTTHVSRLDLEGRGVHFIVLATRALVKLVRVVHQLVSVASAGAEAPQQPSIVDPGHSYCYGVMALWA